nr:FAD-dependent oxidoreductase [Lachnospiraceae bacterium]
GGLLRYGIPNMKLDKSVIDRRVELMKEAGVTFITGTDVGKDVKASDIEKEYDAVILAGGASEPRDIKVPGREAKEIRFAVDFLTEVTKKLLDSDMKEKPESLVKGKNVIVIGGGDTGNDCVGTSIRLGAKSVTQLEMMPKPSETRLPSNPWPEWPRVLKTDYGQEEAISCFGHDPRIYQTTVEKFVTDKKGKLKGAVIVSLKPKKDPKTGRMNMEKVEGSQKEIPADLVLIAAGFLGSQSYVKDAFKVESDARTNVKTEPGSFRASKEKIYTAGDMHSGQSLVVRAIAEGRNAAKQVDEDLMGYTNL